MATVREPGPELRFCRLPLDTHSRHKGEGSDPQLLELVVGQTRTRYLGNTECARQVLLISSAMVVGVFTLGLLSPT